MMIFNTHSFPAYEEIMDGYAKEFKNYVFPKGGTTFGFWVQTLADLEVLDLELRGLTDQYVIDPINRTVDLENDQDFIRLRIAHLEKVKGKTTLYADIVDKFCDTNSYAFHNLCPFKGKLYPWVARSLINAFKLDYNSLLLDPFNGSGTITHEASLIGIKSVGIDVNPVGILLAELKNDLVFLDEEKLNFKSTELQDILQTIENNRWDHSDSTIHKLMLLIYFDIVGVFAIAPRYNKKNKNKIFIEKLSYIKQCHKKIMEIKEKYRLKFEPSRIIESDILKLRDMYEMEEKFDACITSPPYYPSASYIEKEKIIYDYLGIDIKKIEPRFLGARNNRFPKDSYGGLPIEVVMYYEDLKESMKNIFWALKPKGKLAIIIGDILFKKDKTTTTMVIKNLCEEIGFEFEKLIFSPSLATRPKAIKGESVIIFSKP